MSNDFKIFDRAVGHHQPMLGAEIAPLDRGAINYLPDMRPIVRMSSIDHHLYSRLCRRLVFKYSISFIGPVDFPARDVPAETPRVAQLLRRRQIHLAPAQRFLGPLAFGSFAGFAQRTLHRWQEPR